MARSTPRPGGLALALATHLAVTVLVWRDIARRPAGSLRGGKNLWRALSALNTSGSLAYLLVGRLR